MIGHLFKMVWNRKRANALVAIEIGIAFLVLFAVVSLTAWSAGNYRRPLGFTWQNILNVKINARSSSDDTWGPDLVETTRRLVQAAREFPEVEGVAATLSPPYAFNNNLGGFTHAGRSFECSLNEGTDNFKDLMGLSLVSGRWFTEEDNGANFKPIVINEALARLLFGADNPLGKRLREPAEGEREERVVGVISDFRRAGEFSGAEYVVFYRANLDDSRANLDDPGARPPRNLLVRLKPGTPRAFEERLAGKLQSVAREYSFEVSPLSELRETMSMFRRAPIVAAGVVAAFLMLMVGLGLTGVLWQNVTQRTKEIGLRRAKGATQTDIHVLVLGELFVITSIGIVLGAVVALQLPLLGLLGTVGGKVYAISFGVSIVILYSLTMLCGLYPSALAARIQPAEALHYE